MWCEAEWKNLSFRYVLCCIFATTDMRSVLSLRHNRRAGPVHAYSAVSKDHQRRWAELTPGAFGLILSSSCGSKMSVAKKVRRGLL